MKRFFFIIVLISGIICQVNGQTTNQNKILSLGIEYRQLPIDIENSPRNGSTSGKAVFYGHDFWKCLSIQFCCHKNLKNNWQVSLISYIRYNHLHWLELPEDGIAELQDLDEKKNFKFDLFLTMERRKSLNKNKEHYLFASGGIGLSNLNTKYDVYFKDTLPSGAVYEERFNGTFLRFTPRFEFGIQFRYLKIAINSIIIEGPDLTDLTSLWLGLTMSYQLPLKMK